MTLQKLIQSKKFDYVNGNINEVNFPQPKKLRKGYKLFHFNKYISSEDAVKKMEKEESVKHLVTVLSIWLEELMNDFTYKKSCEYIENWVEYRMPKKLKKKIK